MTLRAWQQANKHPVSRGGVAAAAVPTRIHWSGGESVQPMAPDPLFRPKARPGRKPCRNFLALPASEVHGSVSPAARRRLGLHHRVALVGFDDFLLADLLDPGITVIAQDPAGMGKTAAELLFRRLDGERSGSVHLVIRTRLIPRGSGEIQP